MMDKSIKSISRCALMIITSAQLVISGAGCSLIKAPYVDDFANQAKISTPSVDGVRAATTTPRDAHRTIAATTLQSQDDSVSHSPLFFESDQDIAFVEDGSFAWTGADFIQVFVGPGQFLVNAALSPISMYDTPPWTTMVSDGRPSRKVWGVEHDAAKQ